MIECEVTNSATSVMQTSAQHNTMSAACRNALQEIVQKFGTPTYAYDVRCIKNQVEKLRANIPSAVDILYSLKANASLGVCRVLAECGMGADIASAGELLIAQTAGFPNSRIYLTGPDKSPQMMTALQETPDVVVSLDSLSELRLFAEAGLTHRTLLRLRPDFCSYATCSAGPDSRFGLTMDQVDSCRTILSSSQVNVVGFHVFSGSQVLANEGVVHHLCDGVELALRASRELGITPEIIDIGGGFGIPYGPEESELDLALIGAELESLVSFAAPARLVIELGRFFVAQAGWYLTSVLSEQSHKGRPAVVVDGGSHQRTDMCGVGLKQKVAPFFLNDAADASYRPTDVLGCLSLPADVLVEAGSLPPLSRGNVLAFPTAGAYGLYAAPCLFHGHPPPAEVAFDGTAVTLFRARKSVQSVLDGQ